MIIFDAVALKVLSEEQQAMKPLLEEFMKTHFLVGGTAIALHLGHRRSIDFDLFTLHAQGTGTELSARIQKVGMQLEAGSSLHFLSTEEEPEALLLIKGVKVQLINFNRNPFGVDVTFPHDHVVCDGIMTPSLLDLAALKAFAMMYRKKWKDAVDLYFLLHSGDCTFTDVIARTKEIFGILYMEIATLETILENAWDTTEAVEYLVKDVPQDKEVREYLILEAEKCFGNNKM